MALAWGVGLILLSGAGAVLLRRTPRVADRVYACLLLVGCGLGVASAIRGLSGSPEATASLAGPLPVGPWAFGLDPLSSWFLLAILGVGAAAGVFGTTYLAPERGHRNVPLAHALFAVLLVGLTGVVTARAIVPFLAAWEVMAVSAYLLVMFESDRSEVRRAGLIYIVLTHLSTLALIGMFAALSVHAGGRTFADLAAGNQAASAARTLALGLAVVGFGIKAGAVPLHFWLPGAHAAAPSHVSAVLSGVMLKVGIYGLLRVISLLGPPPPWLGWTLLGLGLASGVLGVLWAMAQHELKRLLAYHSVENIGIILLGMGVGTLGLTYGQPVVALLGFMGAVLHSLNHALFKSLLFLGAGAVVRATGTLSIDHLGGVGRRMPLTAAAFGVGSVAIVGLPPLNGFVSEWVVFGALLAAGRSHELLRFAVLGAAGLALIGGLALACFSKVNGALFLGRPRESLAGSLIGREPRGMVVPALGLAAACVAIGLVPALALGPARRAVASVIHPGDGSAEVFGEWAQAAARVSAMALAVLLAAAALAVLRSVLRGARKAGVGETWACAGMPLTPRMQYSAASYAAPLLAAFGPLAGVRESREPDAFHSSLIDLVQDGAALPAWRKLENLSQRLRGWQRARIRWYLLSVVATLLTLLYYLMQWKDAQ
jgi:hydrogenase-4 component B